MVTNSPLSIPIPALLYPGFCPEENLLCRAACPSRWIWASQARCTRTCTHAPHVHVHLNLLASQAQCTCTHTCSHARAQQSLSSFNGKVPSTGCHPSLTEGHYVLFPESTEFPPGMLPGAKVGMYSLFFLVKLWEVLCFPLKDVSVRTGLILRGSNSWHVPNQN